MPGTSLVRSDWYHPVAYNNILRFGLRSAGMFDGYDPNDPSRLITWNANGSLNKTGSTTYQWLLNFDATEGPLTTGASPANVPTDGSDVLFGDYGSDWIVGGTGNDTMWGGWGNDMLNADDLQTTDGGLNTSVDENSSYADRAYGGAGLDVLFANAKADRLIDWVGEFNSYLVPFSAFGMPTVSRTVNPGLRDFLYALSRSQGADPFVVQVVGNPDRNGEPFGEIGVVIQQDAAWQDQNGGPRDPQPGSGGGGGGGQKPKVAALTTTPTTTLSTTTLSRTSSTAVAPQVVDLSALVTGINWTSAPTLVQAPSLYGGQKPARVDSLWG